MDQRSRHSLTKAPVSHSDWRGWSSASWNSETPLHGKWTSLFGSSWKGNNRPSRHFLGSQPPILKSFRAFELVSWLGLPISPTNTSSLLAGDPTTDRPVTLGGSAIGSEAEVSMRSPRPCAMRRIFGRPPLVLAPANRPKGRTRCATCCFFFLHEFFPQHLKALGSQPR